MLSDEPFDLSRSFPPKNAKPKIDNSPNFSSLNTTMPSVLLASSDIWDEAIRNGLAKPRFKKKDLDDRRSKVNVLYISLVSFRDFNLPEQCSGHPS